MIKRRRFKQVSTLEERLSQENEKLREQASNLKPGVALDDVLRRIRQNDTASHMSEWLRSPGLQAPA